MTPNDIISQLRQNAAQPIPDSASPAPGGKRESKRSTSSPRPSASAGNMQAAVEAVRTLPGIRIEICGAWAWVTGETEAHKSGLRAAGFRWHSGKAAFYFPGCPVRPKGPSTLGQVRAWHGSQVVKDDTK